MSLSMGKFFFNVIRDGTYFEDRDGREFSTLALASQHALFEAKSILRDEPEWPSSDQWIDITNVDGISVGTVQFGEAVVH